MKRFTHLMALAIAVAAILQTSCKKDEQPAPPVLEDIVLEQDELTLTEGDEATLKVTLTPAEVQGVTLAWESNKEEVVTVDQDGKVTAVAEGTARITVTATQYGLSANCKIKVEKKSIAVTGLELDKNQAEMTEGDELTLTATVTPEDATDKTISWSSDHPEIVEVENGKVTAGIPGTAIITAEAQGQKATCTITVKKRAIAVTGLELDKTSASLKIGQTLQLTATVNPDNATDKTVSWSSDHPEFAKVDNTGKVTAISPGTANITASTAGNLFTKTCVITVQEIFSIDAPVSSGLFGETIQLTTKGGTAESWEVKRVITDNNQLDSYSSISSEGLLTIKKASKRMGPRAVDDYSDYDLKVTAVSTDGQTATKVIKCYTWKIKLAALAASSSGQRFEEIDEASFELFYDDPVQVFVVSNANLSDETLSKFTLNYDSQCYTPANTDANLISSGIGVLTILDGQQGSTNENAYRITATLGTTSRYVTPKNLNYPM